MFQHAFKRHNGRYDFRRGRCRPLERTTEQRRHNCRNSGTIIRHHDESRDGPLDDDANGNRRDRVHHNGISNYSITNRNNRLNCQGNYNDDGDVFTSVECANDSRETRRGYVYRDATSFTIHRKTISAVQHVNVLSSTRYSGALENTR